MTQVTLYDGTNWYLQKKTKTELDIFLADVKQSQMDLVILVDGKEGTGKSFTARGLAKYCATFLGSTFGVEDIEFDTKAYVRSCLKAGPAEVSGVHKINVLDEARKVVGRGKIHNSKVEGFLDFISEGRDLGQVHIICVPAFHDLKRYLVLWRKCMIIHMLKQYEKDSGSLSGHRLKRGSYKVYMDEDQIRDCYDGGHYRYPKHWVDWNWWSSKEVFSQEQVKEYLEKKRKYTVLKYGDKDEESLSPKQVELLIRRTVAKRMYADKVMVKDIARWFNCSSSVISEDLENKIVLRAAELPNKLKSSRNSSVSLETNASKDSNNKLDAEDTA